VYKSSTVHVPAGLPPNSESRPTPRSRPATSTPAYSQQSYGQPAYGQPAYQQQRRQPVPAFMRPNQPRRPNEYAQGAQESRAPVPIPQASRNQPPPPPPPPPTQPPAPIQPPQPIYRALYDFQGQTASELSFSKGEVLDITKKEGNGMIKLCYIH
jgi:myosin-1